MNEFLPIPDLSCSIKVLSGRVVIKAVAIGATTDDLRLRVNGYVFTPELKEDVTVYLSLREALKGPGFDLIYNIPPGTSLIEILCKKNFNISTQRALSVQEL